MIFSCTLAHYQIFIQRQFQPKQHLGNLILINEGANETLAAGMISNYSAGAFLYSAGTSPVNDFKNDSTEFISSRLMR
jgi:sulfate adenylyltransferase subunit 1 (EFTu-like GTPase family)